MDSLNLVFQLRELACDAKIGKDRHFIAADRKAKINKYMGVAVVILNVAIGSTVFNLVKNHTDPQIITSAVSFLAAALAGVGTYFNFSKDVDNHRRIGNLYLNVSRKSADLLAKFKDRYIDRDNLLNEYENLHDIYKNANEEGESCPNSVNDYQKALKRNKRTKDDLNTLKSELLK
jgi:hypothetical protein